MIVTVADQSEVAQARRVAERLATTLGFDELGRGRVAIIATEMASNLLKHAGRGQIGLDSFTDAGGSGIQLLAFDKGRGIADLGRAFEDGYSTAGSAGTGLGAIRRQADDFGIYSRAGIGTVLMARLRLAGGAPDAGNLTVGSLLDPFPGEIECGDDWASVELETGPIFMMIDGSGHGPAAATAARAAIQQFQSLRSTEGVFVMETLHRVLAPTRGGAVAVAFVDRPNRLVRFVGVGNISAALVADVQTRRMISNNGIVGHATPRIREFTYPFGENLTLILHSDGLSAKWDVAEYPGIMVNHPSLLAGALMRDHRRAKDDASVLVAKVKV